MMELIDDDYLQEAILSPQQGRHGTALAPVAAACLAALLFGGAMWGFFGQRKAPASPAVSASDTGKTVDIPVIKLPASNDASVMDMMAFLEYDGRMYCQAAYIDYAESPNLRALLGRKLGTADGSFCYDCIHPEPERVETNVKNAIPSNVTGDVYTVRGYDETFRLCIPEMCEGSQFMAFFECLNGISYRTGREIFDDRLHLPGHVAGVIGRDQENRLQMLDLTADVDAFIDELCAAPACERTEVQPEGRTTESKLLALKLLDGTEADIVLFSHGYAFYDECYVKPGNTALFDSIYAQLPNW